MRRLRWLTSPGQCSILVDPPQSAMSWCQTPAVRKRPGSMSSSHRLATPAYLDRIGTPDVAASLQAVDALLLEVESAYKQELR